MIIIRLYKAPNLVYRDYSKCLHTQTPAHTSIPTIQNLIYTPLKQTTKTETKAEEDSSAEQKTHDRCTALETGMSGGPTAVMTEAGARAHLLPELRVLVQPVGGDDAVRAGRGRPLQADVATIHHSDEGRVHSRRLWESNTKVTAKDRRTMHSVGIPHRATEKVERKDLCQMCRVRELR